LYTTIRRLVGIEDVPDLTVFIAPKSFPIDGFGSTNMIVIN